MKGENQMPAVKNGDTVKVAYSVKLEDGTIFDSTNEQEPFQFTLGQGQAILGFEKAVIGMQQGDSKTENINAQDAYGSYNEALIIEVNKDKFPSDFQFEAGQHLLIPDDSGEKILVTVYEVKDTSVIFDKNHPLAGKNLIIDIKLIEIMS